VIPAGLGGLPGVNGSETPVMPVGPVKAKKGSSDSDGDTGSSDTGGDAAKPDAVRAASTPTGPPAVSAPTASTPPAAQTSVAAPTAPLKAPRKRKGDAATSELPEAKDAPPSVLVDRALGRGPHNGDSALAAPLTDSIAVQPAASQSESPGPKPVLEQTVPSEDKVIGHSLKVPLPEPVVEDPPMAFEPDADPVGDWSPPKPRPAFDPLTAPLDEIHPD